MPLPETGRQRAARIPLDYYKHRDQLERVKLWLGGLALVGTLGWLAAGLLQGDGGRQRYARGPVAAVHAIWEDNCGACHVPFTPIRGDTWASGLTGHALVGNERCTTCHAGPVHHANQTPDLACASCHRDHRGRDASLVHLGDRDCTQCHRDLAAHVQDGGQVRYRNVSRFDAEHHPEFKILRDRAPDPGRLKFSHQRHLIPGMDANFTLKKLAEAERGRYGREGQTKEDLVRLDCASCHQLDSRDFKTGKNGLAGVPGAAVRPARAAGAYLLPITYENQCKACHPLALGPGLSVPHRMQPREIHELLEGYYTSQVLKANRKLFEKFVPRGPLPGKLLGDQQDRLRDVIRGKVLAAEMFAYNKSTCGECHWFETRTGQPVPDPVGRLRKGGVPDLHVPRPQVPQVWFEHAFFNHATHRGLDCRACHPRAYVDDPHASTRSDDVLLPGIQNCLQCHAPQTRSGGKVRGGARFDCAECHRYHNGANPRQGMGARSRGPALRRDIEQFLNDLPAAGRE